MKINKKRQWLLRSCVLCLIALCGGLFTACNTGKPKNDATTKIMFQLAAEQQPYALTAETVNVPTDAPEDYDFRALFADDDNSYYVGDTVSKHIYLADIYDYTTLKIFINNEEIAWTRNPELDPNANVMVQGRAVYVGNFSYPVTKVPALRPGEWMPTLVFSMTCDFYNFTVRFTGEVSAEAGEYVHLDLPQQTQSIQYYQTQSFALSAGDCFVTNQFLDDFCAYYYAPYNGTSAKIPFGSNNYAAPVFSATSCVSQQFKYGYKEKYLSPDNDCWQTKDTNYLSLADNFAVARFQLDYTGAFNRTTACEWQLDGGTVTSFGNLATRTWQPFKENHEFTVRFKPERQECLQEFFGLDLSAIKLKINDTEIDATAMLADTGLTLSTENWYENVTLEITNIDYRNYNRQHTMRSNMPFGNNSDVEYFGVDRAGYHYAAAVNHTAIYNSPAVTCRASHCLRKLQCQLAVEVPSQIMVTYTSSNDLHNHSAVLVVEANAFTATEGCYYEINMVTGELIVRSWPEIAEITAYGEQTGSEFIYLANEQFGYKNPFSYFSVYYDSLLDCVGVVYYTDLFPGDIIFTVTALAA